MKTLFISAALFIFLSAGYAHAATQTASQFCQGGSCTYVPLEPLPGLPTSYGGSGSFPALISSSFKLLIGAGALIAIIMIVLGALTYMFSDIVGNKKKALDRIRGAMWAIVLLVSSYLILYTINPDLVKLSLNLSITNNFTTSPNYTGTTPAPNPTNQTQPAQTQPVPGQIQGAPTPAQISQCEANGGYFTFINGNNSVCNLPTTRL